MTNVSISTHKSNDKYLPETIFFDCFKSAFVSAYEPRVSYNFCSFCRYFCIYVWKNWLIEPFWKILFFNFFSLAALLSVRRKILSFSRKMINIWYIYILYIYICIEYDIYYTYISIYLGRFDGFVFFFFLRVVVVIVASLYILQYVAGERGSKQKWKLSFETFLLSRRFSTWPIRTLHYVHACLSLINS